MGENIELTLVVRPENGSLDIFSFGYNLLQQQGDNAADFMMEAMTRRHNTLRPDGTVRWRLQEIRQLFHPGFSPLGAFVLQVPGTIAVPPAQPAGSGIELQEVKMKLLEAERKLNMVETTISQKEKARQQAEAARGAAETDKLAAEQRLTYAQEEVAREKKGCELWESKYQEMVGERQTAEEALATAQTQRDMLERQLERTQQQLKDASKKIDELTAQVAQAKDNPKLVQENNKLKQRVGNLDSQVADLNEEIKRLKKRIEELEDQPFQPQPKGSGWDGDLPS